MTQYRVTVQVPRSTSQWGDVFVVNSPADVRDRNGVLIVHRPPFAGSPEQITGDGRRLPARRATGPSQVVYPRGGWLKVTITEILEEVA